MALDIGHKRIGVAISDPLRMTARPLQTLQRRNLDVDAAAIAQLAEEWDVAEIIVGKPLHLDGRNALIMQTIQTLVGQIQKHIDLPIRWIDERLSSKEAEELMAESGIRVADRRSRRDEFAAAVILRRYLEESSHEPI
ncbi:MAG TPA: Holliday junction resolvase RuvX [Acidobacteriota bacterium]|nr:Holliday junction resolvase RuvX [Acidobacteriota bacterium]